ncbi:MAG: hypothetical protein RL708_2216 [Bacteroidota bacterium]|jgi:Zn-dependent peptidase ImmA (M78 family)
MNLKKIKESVATLLNNISENDLPINVENIAKAKGILIKPYKFDDDVSGLLSIENGKSVIGVNIFESRVRRRFTVAHELGHYELHKEDGNLFVDSHFKVYRSPNSKETPYKQRIEEEANSFAAMLLMPEDLLRNEVKKIEFDLGSEETIKALSKKFDVSSTAMYFRLSNLELI